MSSTTTLSLYRVTGAGLNYVVAESKAVALGIVADARGTTRGQLEAIDGVYVAKTCDGEAIKVLVHPEDPPGGYQRDIPDGARILTYAVATADEWVATFKGRQGILAGSDYDSSRRGMG